MSAPPTTPQLQFEAWLLEHQHQLLHGRTAYLQDKLKICLAQLANDSTTMQQLETGLAIAQHALACYSDAESLLCAILWPLTTDPHRPSSATMDNAAKPSITWPSTLLPWLKQLQQLEHYEQRFAAAGALQEQPSYLEKFRKLLLASCNDARIILLKLCQQLVALEHLRRQKISPHNLSKTQQELVQRVIKLYAPLANRLGISHIKWQLEDLSLRFSAAEIYHQTAKALAQKRPQRETYLQTLRADMTFILQQAGLANFQIQARAKHIASIVRKLQDKQLTMQQLHDTLAIRILVNDVQDCYTALSHVHEHWDYLPSEFSDYIAHPKANGYQSVHTIVRDATGRSIEIQIRTRDMHQAAELGIAAHWRYKEGLKHNHSNQQLQQLRQQLPQSSTASNLQPVAAGDHSSALAAVTPCEIQVFTPQGNLISLPPAATAVDFAYAIHAEVGHTCKGALRNGILISLTQALHNGDQVEIQRQRNHTPSRDWLNPYYGYITTRRARQHINRWFKQQQYTQHLQQGQALWDKHIKPHHFPKAQIRQLILSQNRQRLDDLLVAIGSGELSPHNLLHRLQSLQQRTTHQTDSAAASTKELAQSQASRRSGARSKQQPPQRLRDGQGLLIQTAGCCLPLPGDEISGYITQGRGISLHRSCCTNLAALQQRHPERQLQSNWPQTNKNRLYQSCFNIEADYLPELLSTISNIIRDANWPLQQIHSRLESKRSNMHIRVCLRIDHLASLSKLFNQLQQLHGVEKIYRQH